MVAGQSDNQPGITHPIGVMQGRLVPQVDRRIQAFPWRGWRDEFQLAQRHRFDSIEWVFEAERYRENPLFTDSGRRETRALIEQTGVPVSAVCADYFMARPFHGVPARDRDHSVEVLIRLIQSAAEVGARRVEIPCVDNASIQSEDDERSVRTAVGACLNEAEKRGVELVFETDLPPEAFGDFLDRFKHPLIRANYDTGNSAALGYDPVRELTMLGTRIANIHIKDRRLRGVTVPLGTGHADFPAIFQTLAEIDYRGPFVLQTARDPDDVAVAVRYRDQVRSYVASAFARS